MRGLARAPLVGLVLMVAGCGGPEFTAETEGSDAGAPATDGATIDATIDATTPGDGSAPPHGDASVGSDAGDAAAVAPDGGSSDAGGGDGAAPPFTCATMTGPDVVFCSDFDESDAAPWNWSFQLPSATGASIAVDKTDYISPPNGFESTTQLLGVTSQATFASLGYTFTSGLNHIEYTFSLYVKASSILGTVPFARIGVAGELFLALALKGGQVELDQSFTGSDGGPATQTSTIPGMLGTNEWVRIQMLLDRTATSPTLTVFEQGGVTPVLSTGTAINPSGESLEVDLGVEDVVPPMNKNEITFDNVLVRAY